MDVLKQIKEAIECLNNGKKGDLSFIGQVMGVFEQDRMGLIVNGQPLLLVNTSLDRTGFHIISNQGLLEISRINEVLYVKKEKPYDPNDFLL